MNALRITTANDNIAALVVEPAEPVEPMAFAAVPQKPATPADSTARPNANVTTLLIVWTLLGAASATVWPLGFGVTAIAALGIASVLSIAAQPSRSTAILALATVTLAVGTIAALAGTQSALALLTLGLWSGGVWMIQCALAARWRSPECALVSTLVLIAVGLFLLGTVETALATLPLVASGAMVMFGIARMAVKGGVATSEVHYAVWWSMLVACAYAVQLLYPDLPSPTQATALAAAIVAAGAAYAWALDRGANLVTGLAVIAAFTLIYNPHVQSVVAQSSFASAGAVVPAVFGAGIFAAALAMCARGLKRDETPTMLLGAAVMLIEVLLVSRAAPAEPELAGLTVVLAGAFAAWLLALRT